jgi:hypothetical protein
MDSNNQNLAPFDLWCLVELFGHTKIAGRCTEQNIAGSNMLRVDVPETASQPSFTRFFNHSAIYSINPVDEATAKFQAEKLVSKPIESWDIKAIVEKHNLKMLESNSSTHPTHDDHPVHDFFETDDE